MRLSPALAAVLVLGIATPVLAQAADAERTMMQTVEAEHGRHVGLLERLVNQNSGTLNAEGVRAVGEMVRAELEPLGFQVRWVDMSETGRAGHLVAVHRGRGRNVLLIGHLDTVFEPDSPFQRFVREGDRATGPGIGDDKGGVVVMIAALRAMQAAGTLGEAKVLFDATSWHKDRKWKGLPDGFKVDREGNLWATGPGGVHVFSPGGKHLGQIDTGEATSLYRRWRRDPGTRAEITQEAWAESLEVVLQKLDDAPLLLPAGSARRVRHLEYEFHRLAGELHAIRIYLAEVESENAGLRHELDALKRSRFWKLTKPARVATRKLHDLRRQAGKHSAN